MNRPVAFLALLTLGLVLATGCTTPFTPARPETPSPGEKVVENFSTADNVLATIESAMRARGASGLAAYTHALADSTGPGVFAFYAFHDTANVRSWHNATGLNPDVWGKTQEAPAFYSYLGEQQPGLTYDFAFTLDDLSEIPPPDTETLAQRHRHYELSASPADGGDAITIAVGYANLYLQKVGNRWFLYRWEDRLDPIYGVTPTDANAIAMGRLRLNSYSRQ